MFRARAETKIEFCREPRENEIFANKNIGNFKSSDRDAPRSAGIDPYAAVNRRDQICLRSL